MVQKTIYFGYVFEEDGTHCGRTELKSSDYKALAEFITNNPTKDKIITDVLDLPVITTFGPFIDRSNTSKINQKALIKELLPLQEKYLY